MVVAMRRWWWAVWEGEERGGRQPAAGSAPWQLRLAGRRRQAARWPLAGGLINVCAAHPHTCPVPAPPGAATSRMAAVCGARALSIPTRAPALHCNDVRLSTVPPRAAARLPLPPLSPATAAVTAPATAASLARATAIARSPSLQPPSGVGPLTWEHEQSSQRRAIAW